MIAGLHESQLVSSEKKGEDSQRDATRRFSFEISVFLSSGSVASWSDRFTLGISSQQLPDRIQSLNMANILPKHLKFLIQKVQFDQQIVRTLSTFRAC